MSGINLRPKIAVYGIGLLGLSIACGKPSPDVTPETLPRIDSISPAEGPAGVAYPIQVTMVGRGFTEAGNVIVFDDMEIGEFESQGDGTLLTFFVPKERDSTGEVPPFPLMPGEYSVVVRNSLGESNSVTFRLTEGGGA